MRLHSLTTRFLLTLLVSTAVPFLGFVGWARGAMEERLDRQIVKVFLPDQAASAAGVIRARLRQIQQGCGWLRNAATVVLSAGGDPRDFEREVDFTRGISPDLVLLVDARGQQVAHRLHPRLDPMTRGAREALLRDSVAELPWFRQIAAGAGEVWEDRHLSPFLHRTPQRSSLDPADYSFALAFSVPTAEPDRHGALYALVRWHEVQQVLDDTAAFLRERAGFPSAQVLVCNAEGTYLAHTDRSLYAGARLPEALRAVLPEPGREIEADFPHDDREPKRAGLAAVDVLPGLRWWVGVHAERSELLATSRELGDVLLGVAAVTTLILVVWSMVASRTVLRPVHRLAFATESVARGDLSVRVPAKGKGELADLGRAFNRMAEDLERSREQLRVAERERAWVEMARQVAHEIKNPLTPMRMSAQLLLRKRKEQDARWPELADRLCRTVLEQTGSLARIAGEFRQFAGPPSRHLEPLQADELLRDSEAFLAAMAEVSGVALTFRPGAPGVRVEVDRDEMRRVLLNLIHNAFAACGERGRVEVGTEVVEGLVVFRVEDSGQGMPEDVKERLFDPYFTTKSSGTGLGLAICRRIVEAHRGRIALESSVPGRTVFRFELPVCG